MDGITDLFRGKPATPSQPKSEVDYETIGGVPITPAQRAEAKAWKKPAGPSLWDQIVDAPRYYLGPTGLDKKLGVLAQGAAMMSPGADMMDAARASGDIMRAQSPMDAAAAGASMVAALGSMFIPGNANAMAEGLTKFAADQSGALPLGGLSDAAAQRGAQVIDMLKSSRAAEVTDEMLDLGDPVLNTRLNEYLFNNYDLPMDAASRAKRAKSMGLKTSSLHGTDVDVQAFNATRPGGSPGVYTSGDTDVADAYARRRNDLTGEGNPNYMPLVQDPKAMNKFGSDYRVTYDPSSLRSRFARFDPRLSHLRNLSAGIGGLGVASMFAPTGEEQQ